MTDSNKKQLTNNIVNFIQRKPVKIFKNKKGYDRARDRKDKRLYAEEDDFGTDKK